MTVQGLRRIQSGEGVVEAEVQPVEAEPELEPAPAGDSGVVSLAHERKTRRAAAGSR
jgi:hypothetical protein